jgi:hypothetical protein
MSANLQPFSSAGGFVTAGNITVAGYASPAPSINGFSSVNSNSISVGSGNINGGFATVVDDGINSIALAPGAQMDVFGFPFSTAGIRGRLTISGITSTTQANGTWYYQSVSDIAYQLYTDSTYSTLVDATGWTAYTGGGSVAITKQLPASNIVINSNGYLSTFDTTGNVALPGNLNVVGGEIYLTGEGIIRSNYDTVSIQSYDVANGIGRGFRVGDTGGLYLEQGSDQPWLNIVPNAGNAEIYASTATGGAAGHSISIAAGSADQTDYYTTAGGNVNIVGGLGAGNDGGGGGPGGSVNISAGPSADVAGRYGNVVIQTGGSNNWIFDYTGNLSAPGAISASGNVTGGNLITSGSAGNITLTGGNIIGANVVTANIFSASGNITAQNFIGNISITGNVQGTTANVTLVAGSYSTVFDNTGVATFPGNVSVTGNVITPNRPAFRVYGNGNTINLGTTVNTTGNLTINNYAVDYNQGGYLNTTTGIFTAPVAGLYAVDLVARSSNFNNVLSQISVVKNGSTQQCFWEVAANTTVGHMGVSSISKLAVGDTLTLKVVAGYINFDSNDNWSVAFLG